MEAPTNERAEWYRQRFALERTRVTAQIDLDADGKADALRTLNVFQMLRG